MLAACFSCVIDRSFAKSFFDRVIHGEHLVEPGQFQYPSGVYYDTVNDEVLVSDQLGYRVQVFEPDGAFKYCIGGSSANPGSFFQGGRLLAAPQGLWADAQGRIYVADRGAGKVHVETAPGSHATGGWQLFADVAAVVGPGKATDVLSFDLGDGPAGRVGDVYVSLETAARQAEARGHSLDHEVRFLLVHGLLHLSGYGHENDEEEAEMNRVTREHLQAARKHEGDENA